ncbi:MAG TPA: alpha/beta hydrolase [Longimicrobiaceae bacterium]
MKIRNALLLLPLVAAAACERADSPLAPSAGLRHDATTLAAPAVSEGYVSSVDGVSLFYHVEGSGPDTIMVLSGGPGLSYRYMQPDLGPLARGRTVIYYDQRGAGNSTVIYDPALLSMDRQVADVDAIRQHFGIQKLSLVGHSAGALFATLYAAAHPANVERLVLLDPAPATGAFAAEFANNRVSRTAPDQLALQGDLINQFLSGTVADPVASCEVLFHSVFTPYMVDGSKLQHVKFCDEPVPAAANSVFTVLVGLSALDASWDVAPYLHQITAPTLVVHATADPIPAASSQYYADGIAGAQLVTIQNAGHFPWLEQPVAFFSTMETFLRRGDVQQ